MNRKRNVSTILDTTFVIKQRVVGRAEVASQDSKEVIQQCF